VRIIFKAVRFNLPARTNELVRSKAGESFEALGEVMGIEESSQMLLEMSM